MYCLVTGGAGFIGSHLTRRLLRRGHTVTVLDDFSNSDGSLLDPVKKSIRLLRDDIRDPNALRWAMRGADWVFHLAALVSVPQAQKDPDSAWDINAGGTRLVAEEARRAGIRRIVYASSCAVYGDAGRRASSEKDPPRPLSHYAMSKYIGEAFLLTAAGGAPTVVLRFFNVYGPGQRWDSPYAAVIPRFIRQMRLDQPCTVFGDGRQTRDFVFVEDAARALETAASSKGAAGRVFNIASGRSVSVLALHQALYRAAGRPWNAPRFTAARPGEIRFSRASVSAARRILNFKARTGLAEGLRRCWKDSGGADI